MIRSVKCCMLLLLCVVGAGARAQSWSPVGVPDFTGIYARYQSVAIDGSGTPYVAFSDNSYGAKATVMKFSGGSWVTVGTPGFSADTATNTSIAVDGSGTPYVAYTDYANGQKASVMKYNGSAWVAVGSAGFSAGAAGGYHWITIDAGGNPWVAYADGGNANKATVMKYSSGAWAPVGSAGFTDSTAGSVCIALDAGGTPFVSFADAGHSFVSSFFLTGFGTAVQMGPGTTVMKYSGGSWVVVGAAGFSGECVSSPCLAIDASDNPYVAYTGFSEEDKVSVQKYNGTSWELVGSAGFSADTAIFVSLVIDGSGTPWVAYDDEGWSTTVPGVTVKKFTGGSWATVGSSDFSPGLGLYVDLALNTADTPYVVFSDQSDGGRTTVMSFGAATGTKNIDAPSSDLRIFPDPCNGTFTLRISSLQNEDVPVTIVNMLGEKVKEFTAPANADIALRLDLAPGVYNLSALTSGGLLNTKVVVE